MLISGLNYLRHGKPLSIQYQEKEERYPPFCQAAGSCLLPGLNIMDSPKNDFLSTKSRSSSSFCDAREYDSLAYQLRLAGCVINNSFCSSLLSCQLSTQVFLRILAFLVHPQLPTSCLFFNHRAGYPIVMLCILGLSLNHILLIYYASRNE